MRAGDPEPEGEASRHERSGTAGTGGAGGAGGSGGSGRAAEEKVLLDGESLSIAALARIARDPRVVVEIAPAALARVAAGWSEIQGIAERYATDFAALQRGEREVRREKGGQRRGPSEQEDQAEQGKQGEEDGRSAAIEPALEYGVTTGFGEFKDIPVPPGDLEQLQRNILLSHSVGVGASADPADPANLFPPEVVRAALAIRLNAFLKGFSGVRVELARAVQRMLNLGIVPLVPQRGSVGSSGDLCPLAHLFAVLLGEGRFYRVRQPEDLPHQPREVQPASRLGEALGIEVPQPSYKEGLALTNGATFSAALLALAVADGESAANAADIAAALTFEAVCGCARALDPRVHAARGHAGQADSAANLRNLLAGSSQMERAGAVQDVYSLRCAPQVHGAARDTIAYARMVAETEINAATDNPLFFPGTREAGWDAQFSANAGYSLRHRISYSAGNFHGEPVGIAADLLAIGLAELANISERRVQMLLDSHHNRNLPGNLIALGGLNSGFMIAQYTAAALVSENKVLAHPASVDSIPTSANAEDHNAMATIAARKLRSVLHNAQAVLAIELLVAAQAVEWRVAMARDPLLHDEAAPAGGERAAGIAPAVPRDLDAPPDKRLEARPDKRPEARPDKRLEARPDKRPETRPDNLPEARLSSRLDARLERLLRKHADLEAERDAFSERTGPTRRADIAARLGRGTAKAYLRVRALAPPLVQDRALDEDIRRLRAAIEDGSLVAGLQSELETPLLSVPALAAHRG